MRRLLTLIVTLFAFASAGAAFAADTPRTFIRKAIEGNLAEVQAGTLAASRASDPDVRAFGRQLARDHSRANYNARRVAWAIGVVPPQRPSYAQRQMYRRLASLTGRRFDRAFVAHMMRDHEQAVFDYRTQARVARILRVRNYASQTLPTLRRHLQTAESLSDDAYGGRDSREDRDRSRTRDRDSNSDRDSYRGRSSDDDDDTDANDDDDRDSMRHDDHDDDN